MKIAEEPYFFASFSYLGCPSAFFHALSFIFESLFFDEGGSAGPASGQVAGVFDSASGGDRICLSAGR